MPCIPAAMVPHAPAPLTETAGALTTPFVLSLSKYERIDAAAAAQSKTF